MTPKKLVVIDYGAGNIASLANALRCIGVPYLISSSARDLEESQFAILPGVGSFCAGMRQLRKYELDRRLLDFVERPNTRLFGICLGMQLLFEGSEEGGGETGLGLLKGVARLLPRERGLNVPHVGFDSIYFEQPSPLVHSLSSGTDFYFTHSYALALRDSEYWVSWFCHGQNKYIAAVDSAKISAVQFHPEKSQSNGLVLFKNALGK